MYGTFFSAKKEAGPAVKACFVSSKVQDCEGQLFAFVSSKW